MLMSDTSEQALTSLTAAEASSLAEAVLSRAKGEGVEAKVQVEFQQESRAEFARNALRVLDGATNFNIILELCREGRTVQSVTQLPTPEGLDALVADAERALAASGTIPSDPNGLYLIPPAELKDPPGMYFDATLAAGSPTFQAEQVQVALRLAKSAGQIAAGLLGAETRSYFTASSSGYQGFTRSTYAEFDMSTRAASGKGSGWAGVVAEDVGKVDVEAVARRAIDLAQRSDNPVAVEPGRYTVIIEPEALAAMLTMILMSPTFYMRADFADSGGTVFSKEYGKPSGNRIGQKMTDPRVQLLYDPQDPLMPFSPLHKDGMMQRTHWIENGVLKNLPYDPAYARKKNTVWLENPFKARLEVNAPPQTLEQMIKSTQRGVWIHNFSELKTLVTESLLLSGLTRDGTFLIENGKVTKPIKNMRFLESPFFVLSKLAAASEPVRAGRNIVCPRLKVHDFEFTSLSDAI